MSADLLLESHGLQEAMWIGSLLLNRIKPLVQRTTLFRSVTEQTRLSSLKSLDRLFNTRDHITIHTDLLEVQHGL